MPSTTPQRPYIIVFGAAVRANGRPSLALRRRIDAAVRWADEHPEAMVMPTGGVGAAGPPEAQVMRDALVEAGIAHHRIVMESCGRDTLEQIRLCHALLAERGDCERILCCTSAYHQPRCALLLRLLGYKVATPKMTASHGRLSRKTYVRMVLKEVVALPYDATLLLMRRPVGG